MKHTGGDHKDWQISSDVSGSYDVDNDEHRWLLEIFPFAVKNMNTNLLLLLNHYAIYKLTQNWKLKIVIPILHSHIN